ncbi:MAG: NUDIX domain-containing protein [Candidatus Magasanikbacteria bacterium]
MHLPPNTIIASGPVIIENKKVLLNREKKESGITSWFFPGGEVEDFDKSLEEACRREVKEEMGIEVEIIKPLRTLLHKRPEKEDQLVILVHYHAKRIGEIKPGKEIIEWGWYDIYNLPENCAPNVFKIIEDYIQENK